MDDYDNALTLDPNNFLGHYNRGLLRMQLGDDNRAIKDFDFVVQHEPQNVMAIFNRAILHDKTGDLRAAIHDYTAVINQFPNFWTGLSYRASCYRRLGMTGKAEQDEFRIFKAQMDKQVGVQPRWSKAKLKQVRKRSEIDLDKYNSIVVDDEVKTEHEYKSEYRGRVQNRSVEVEFMPMYQLSYFPYNNGVNSRTSLDSQVEQFNLQFKPLNTLYVNCNPTQLQEGDTRRLFSLIDSLSTEIARSHHVQATKHLLFQRAVAYSVMQDFNEAIDDLTSYLHIDSTSMLAYWQRAVCQSMMGEYNASQGISSAMFVRGAIDDLNEALRRSPKNALLYYNRGNFHARQREYQKAIDDFTRAIRLDNRLAEAYYNRGVARMKAGKESEAAQDLSTAGELGIYDAYSLLKKMEK